MRYPITPVPKPRQTRSDKWQQRDCVMRYRAFADCVRASRIDLKPCAHVVFHIPMPRSWSSRKSALMVGKPHCQKPDLDNLAKALMDAMFKDDSHVWKLSLEKRWACEGAIEITYEESEK